MARVDLGNGPFDYVYCAIRLERRFVFRKNPPRHDMENGGANCKRYYPQTAAKYPQGDDWVEFPNASLERTRRSKRQRKPHEQTQ